MTREPPIVAGALAAWFCLLSAGCALKQVAEDQKKDAALVRLAGTISAVEPGEGPLVVVLMRRPARDEPEDAIVDYYARETDGAFYFDGSSFFTAFEHTNHDDHTGLDSGQDKWQQQDMLTVARVDG